MLFLRACPSYSVLHSHPVRVSFACAAQQLFAAAGVPWLCGVTAVVPKSRVPVTLLLAQNT